MHDARVLKFVIGILGAKRLMMGSDMPFPIGDMDPAAIVSTAGLKTEEVARINGGLAQQIFRIGG